jgi:hypothetical protein
MNRQTAHTGGSRLTWAGKTRAPQSSQVNGDQSLPSMALLPLHMELSRHERSDFAQLPKIESICSTIA